MILLPLNPLAFVPVVGLIIAFWNFSHHRNRSSS